MERQNIVSKFGGSSMANPESIGLVRRIIDANPSRRIIVVSAPGRDPQNEDKITDLLVDNRVDEVLERFHQLGQKLDWRQADERIDTVRNQLRTRQGRDFRMSRGEWLSAHMLADITDSHFVDSADLLRINGNRTVDSESDMLIQRRLETFEGRVVVPGFYGANKKGWIRTLPRDGSDITGAVITRALGLPVYEIFSDTNGVFDQDPRVHGGARNLPQLSFDEMAVLAKTAKIVQSQVIDILRGTGIAVNCRNTFQPDHPGTWIV